MSLDDEEEFDPDIDKWETDGDRYWRGSGQYLGRHCIACSGTGRVESIAGPFEEDCWICSGSGLEQLEDDDED